MRRNLSSQDHLPVEWRRLQECSGGEEEEKLISSLNGEEEQDEQEEDFECAR